MQKESSKLEMGFLIKREAEHKDLHNSQTGHIVKGIKNKKIKKNRRCSGENIKGMYKWSFALNKKTSINCQKQSSSHQNNETMALKAFQRSLGAALPITGWEFQGPENKTITCLCFLHSSAVLFGYLSCCSSGHRRGLGHLSGRHRQYTIIVPKQYYLGGYTNFRTC